MADKPEDLPSPTLKINLDLPDGGDGLPVNTSSSPAMPVEFEEIAHCGGKITVRVVTNAEGKRAYSLAWNHCRPVAAGFMGVYALPMGIPVGSIDLGGIGQAWNPPPVSGSYPVFVGSDSEGKYGRQCPVCNGYWRGEPWPDGCPYCGMRAQRHQFLTGAQRAYIQQYCRWLGEALSATEDGDHEIDMDAVADAVGKDQPKPPFYYAEQSQQNKFTCAACGTFHDILGKFAYCSACGTRNDVQELETKAIPQIRERINAGGPHEACVKDAVAVFDSLARQYIRQLLQSVPLTPSRRAKLEKMSFHGLKSVSEELKQIFDIDILKGMKAGEIEFATLRFHRRHVYEHNGGEADEKYIADSGDASVRPKQALRETQQAAHDLAGLVVKMARNLHHGFHEILPPVSEPIERYAKRNADRI